MIPEFVAALISLVVLLAHAVGIYLAVRAIMISRTPQAAIGWAFALAIVPYLAIPLFLVFGESRLPGYILAGSGMRAELDDSLQAAARALEPFKNPFPEKYADAERLALRLRRLPATHGNRSRLLIDGERTFEALFGAIDEARDYVVVQFYIIHDDGVGRELKARLLAARGRGARCWLLFDSVGAKKLPPEYIEELRAGGVAVQSFVTNRQHGRRFQINFRNHRKLAVIDGRVAFLGGLNAGDEYRGLGPLGAWRDTHLQIEGPAVQALQVSFLEDWNYACGEVPDLPCQPRVTGDQTVLAFASGPAETWSVTPAVYLEIIHDVRERLWVATPYLVPDPALRTALAHAALRGVDVRLILPKKPDHLLPWLSSFTHYPALLEAGVRIWRYCEGFMHQKVLLADDDLAIVGSVNLDFRSFMLNFELGAVIHDRTLAREVEEMLRADLARSAEEDLSDFEKGSFLFRFRCRLAALMSPEQ